MKGRGEGREGGWLVFCTMRGGWGGEGRERRGVGDRMKGWDGMGGWRLVVWIWIWGDRMYYYSRICPTRDHIYRST